MTTTEITEALRWIDENAPPKRPSETPTLCFYLPGSPFYGDDAETLADVFAEGEAYGLWQAAEKVRAALAARPAPAGKLTIRDAHEWCCTEPTLATVEVRDGVTLKHKGKAVACFQCGERGEPAVDLDAAVRAWNAYRPAAPSPDKGELIRQLVGALAFYGEQWETPVDAERTGSGWVGSIGEIEPTQELTLDVGFKARTALAAARAAGYGEKPA